MMVNFDEIIKLLNNRGRIVGFLYYGSKETNKYLKLFVFLSNINLAIAIAELVGFSYVVRNDLMKLLLQCQIILIDATVTYVAYVLFKSQALFINLANFGKRNYKQKDPLLKQAMKKTCKKGLHYSKMAIYLTTFFLLAAFMFLIVVGTAAGYYIRGDKYPLPLPFYIPYIKPNGWFSYLINLIQQYWAAQTVICYYITLLTAEIVFFINVIFNMNTLIWIIENFELFETETSFEYWLKVIVDMLNDAKVALNDIKDAISGLMYMFEKLSYATVFISWLTVHIDKEAMATTAGASFILIALFIFTVINEICLQKFEDVTTALYKTPWYNMSPKQRRLLIPVLQSAQNYVCLSSGGIQEITFEWYKNLINSGYSTALVLENFI